MKSKSIQFSVQPIIAGFKRYSVTIFIVLLVSSLAGAVLLLNQIVIRSSDTTGVTSNLSPNSFDQETVKRIEALHSSDEYSSASTALPTGRINPFAE
jgi:predicted class III extradiol MEMO1 family dioxygenase